MLPPTLTAQLASAQYRQPDGCKSDPADAPVTKDAADYLAEACQSVAKDHFRDCSFPPGDFAHDQNRDCVYSSQSAESSVWCGTTALGKAIEHAATMRLYWSAVLTRLEGTR